MEKIKYSLLSGRYYFVGSKNVLKIDITDDIKEIIEFEKLKQKPN